MSCPLTNKRINGSVYVRTIHKPSRANQNSFPSSLLVLKPLFTSINLKKNSLHNRITANNGDQSNVFLHEQPELPAFVNEDSAPQKQRILLQLYSVAFMETCDKNILRNGTMYMFCLLQQFSCSLSFVCARMCVQKPHYICMQPSPNFCVSKTVKMDYELPYVCPSTWNNSAPTQWTWMKSHI
jgi:hypothetical protein